MKKALFALLGLAAGAAQAYSFTDYAQVISSVPQYRKVEVETCRLNDKVRLPVASQTTPSGISNDTLGTVLGGVAGGLIGNQIGGGRGRTVATVAGAIGGAMVGRHLGNQQGGVQSPLEPEPRRDCRSSYDNELTGYLVTYDYRGQRDSLLLPKDPGKRLPMRVSAEPLLD